MSDRLKEAVECGSCGSAPTRSVGQENAEPEAQAPAQEQTASAGEVGNAKEKVVVMSGPVGAAITTALNDVYSREIAPNISVGNESLSTVVTKHVYANGMISDQEQFIGAVRKSVGVVPNHGTEPTVINTMLDAVSRVHDMDFLFVSEVPCEASSAVVEGDRTVHVVGVDGMEVTPTFDNAALENYEVSAVQMVVKIRPKRK